MKRCAGEILRVVVMLVEKKHGKPQANLDHIGVHSNQQDTGGSLK